MTLQEKILYHQIHPIKLLTDWAAGFVLLYFFWERQLLAGLLVALVPQRAIDSRESRAYIPFRPGHGCPGVVSNFTVEV